MGAELPTFSSAVSIPVQNSKQQGFSAVYRNPASIQGPILTFNKKIKTMKDIVYESLNKYQDKEFIGQIRLNITQTSDGKTKQQRTLIKFSFKQCVKMAQKVGTFIQKNNLTFKQSYHGMKLIGIYSKNRYQWAISDLSCILYGYTFVPLYQTLGVQNLTYCLQHSQITTLFITSQTIKTLLKLNGFGNLKNLISFDKLPQEILKQIQNKKWKIFFFQDLLDQKDLISHELIKVEPNSCMTFSYTSGTTGPPKGAMISHQNFVSFITAIMNHEVQGFSSQDSYVSFLPLPHLLQRAVFVTILQAGGFMAFYNGDIMKFKDDMAFVKPTLFIAVPRILNRVVEGVQKQFSQLKGFKSWLVKKAVQDKLNYLHQYGDYEYPIYDKLIFSKVRKAFGGRIKIMVTGSAPIKKHTYDMMKILMGCPLYEAYGQTQNTAAAFAQTKLEKEGGHVGCVLTSLQFKLCDIKEMNYNNNDKDSQGRPTPRGQIWLRGPAVFMGYYKDLQKTKEHITEDGWLRTGDIGQLMPGTNALKIIDRKKNIFKLQQGEYIAAEKVQAVYMKNQLVAEAYLHGESTQNFAIVVIVPNKSELIKFAQTNSISGSYQQLCRNKKLRELVCNQLDKTGKKEGLMSFEQAKNLVIEEQSFILRGIVSSTMKLQRFAAKKYYEKQIKQMYSQGPLILK